MVTRAKSLLILIGKETTLQIDANWAEIIELCSQNKAFIRNGKMLHNRIEAPSNV